MNCWDVPPKPNEIQNPRRLCSNAQKVLAIYEDRALINQLGDTRIYDEVVAKLLKISLKTIYNCKQKLIQDRLISTFTKRVKNSSNKLRTIQVIRCWRVMYRLKFRPAKENTWLRKYHPGINVELCKKIIPTNFFSEPPKTEDEVFDYPKSVDFLEILNRDCVNQPWEMSFQLAAAYPTVWDCEIDTRHSTNQELQQTSANGEDLDVKLRLGLTDESRVSKNIWYNEMQWQRKEMSEFIKDPVVLEKEVRIWSKKRNQLQWLNTFYHRGR